MPGRSRTFRLQIGNKAMSSGFRGIAGFDIGELADGSLVAFDLNFRPNSSTGLLLARKAVQQRTGSTCSCTVSICVMTDQSQSCLMRLKR
jgi:hypothetical protein